MLVRIRLQVLLRETNVDLVFRQVFYPLLERGDVAPPLLDEGRATGPLVAAHPVLVQHGVEVFLIVLCYGEFVV